MIAVISPAKLLDEKAGFPKAEFTQPEFAQDAVFLAGQMKKLSAAKVSQLMDLSPQLGELNHRRYQQFAPEFNRENSFPAVLLFKGDVYRGMKADTFSSGELSFAQKHLLILSGLYGVLRPLDLIQPYRLMMGTPFSPGRSWKNLYDYWGNKPSEFISSVMKPKEVLINLASAEYFKAVRPDVLGRRVITCEFKEKKASGYTIVSTYAKLARGYMAGYIVRNGINKPEEIKGFDVEGYRYTPALSTDHQWVFTRQ